MKYLLDVLLDQNEKIEIHRQWLEVEADTEQEAHDKAVAQLKEKYPEATIAVSTFATHEP